MSANNQGSARKGRGCAQRLRKGSSYLDIINQKRYLKSCLIALSLVCCIAISLPSIAPARTLLEISADSVTVFYKKYEAVFEGNVVAISKDMQIKADKVVVCYQNPSVGSEAQGEPVTDVAKIFNANMERLKLLGHIVIRFSQGEAKAKVGEYDTAEETIILQGDVKFTQGQSLVEGEKLIYSLKKKEAKLTSKTDDKGPGAKRAKLVIR